jgi:hypothetical protein
MISILATLLMTRANMGARAAKLASWGIVVALAALALWWAYSAVYNSGRDDERALWEAAAAKIEAADVKADAAGTVTAAETKGQIDAQNQSARDAARDSDDKLRAGLDRLRSQGAGSRDEAAK